jgi:DNA-directed RNA polymerase
MDASHMALVIADWEGDFAAVHDSYSAHAGNVEDLMVKTRQKFVSIYDKENFYDTIPFGKGFEGVVPTIGKLSIKDVADSTYFFC